jgi:hypothetical protein
MSKGVFSSGEQTFKNIYNYANTIPSDNNSLDTSYALQSRLGNYWKNNPASVLMFSKKYSGLTDFENKIAIPLGGPINYTKSNIVNRQDSNFFSDEFDFWNLINCKDSNEKSNENKENFDNSNENKENFDNSNENKENFDNSNENKENFSNLKENFGNSSEEEDDNNDIKICCICLLLIILIIAVIYCLVNN